MRMTPAEIRRARPDVKYVFVRARDFSLLDEGTPQLVLTNPIAKELLLAEAPPESYTLIKTIRSRAQPGGSESTFARLYKLEPRGDSP
jgi:hypothetical protein